MFQGDLILSEDALTSGGLEVELSSLLGDVATKYRAAEIAVSELRSVVATVDGLPEIYEVLEGTYQIWVRGVVERFQLKGQGIGHAVIEVGRLPDDLKCMNSVLRSIRNAREKACPVEAILESFDGEKLVELLDRESSSLEDRGMVEAADKIISDLGMRSDWNSEYPPKKSGRHWIFSKRIFQDSWSGYDYRLGEELVNLSKAMQVAAEDSGIDGLYESAQLIAEEFVKARDVFPSRTVLGKGGAIEGVVFKGKVELRMSHSVGDSLLAFIKIHSTKELRELAA